MSAAPDWLRMADGWIGASILPLACWILLNALDDLFILAMRMLLPPPAPPPKAEQLRKQREQRIAILLPLWREAGVVGDMLDHNIAAIDYHNYHWFAGTYCNDQPTQDAVAAAAARHPNVHLCVCPHDGPTSKADCLNWTYQHMLRFEEQHKVRFHLIVLHDAEDIVHPLSLRWLNHYCRHYDMVQTPVLPLPTPWKEITHGFYCDDFADYHGREMMVRAQLGGFLPSSGVGTGFRRKALDHLAAKESNRIFDPTNLTEDYNLGLRLHQHGFRQLFAPIVMEQGKPVATREFFPKTFAGALRQRSRWVTGIVFQGWERHGWSGGWARIYWFWRDRKGLLGNPLSVAANLIAIYGVLTGFWQRWSLDAATLAVLAATGAAAAIQQAARMVFSARIYGWRHALGVPLRSLYGNFLNTAAGGKALVRFLSARIRHHPLVWVKTEHAYPNIAALAGHKRSLREVLREFGQISEEKLQELESTMPADVTLQEHLLRTGELSTEQLYAAMSLQQSIPLSQVEADEIPAQVARSLPAHVSRQWKVLPLRIAEGSLHLATPSPPTERTQEEIGRFTRLRLRFHLVTPERFEELQKHLL